MCYYGYTRCKIGREERGEKMEKEVGEEI